MTKRCHWFVLSVAATLIAGVSCAVADSAGLTDAVKWLEGESHRLIRASKRTMKDGTAAFPPQVGIGYEAFWLRDFAYTLEGSVSSYSDKELLNASRLFVKSCNADGAGVDCVAFDGRPIYQPGYGTMGDNPVADGSQFTVAVVWHTYRKTHDAAFLKEAIDPLVKTMKAVPRNSATKLVYIKPDGYDRCPYGFTDSVRQAGDVLFCSLLYVEAGHRLAELLNAAGRADDASAWKAEADAVARNIRQVFWDPQVGLFRAATIRCKEHDIWGSAFGVYLGVADESQSMTVARYFRDHYSEIVQRGQIRHLLAGVYWEACSTPRDTYQNGGYWATPTGWFVYTLDRVDSKLADQTVLDLVTDFQSDGACEWILGEKRQLPGYLASACLPLSGIRAMMDHRQSQPVK